MTLDTTLLDIDGPAAPPRSNGELVFAEPWESRAFGMAVTLHAGGAFDWEDFRQELIAAIRRYEAGPAGEEWSYYRCWLEALERVLDVEGVVPAVEVDVRAGELACRPVGHDHAHDHDHGH
jgi:nitrile hydratase accessory protein